MVSSGSGSFPSLSGASVAQIKASAQQIAVRLLTVPDSLQNNRQTLRIEGQVISTGPDKLLLLRTDFGDISIQAKGHLRAREGQRLQIDVPPGSAPKDTVLRPSGQLADTNIKIIKEESPSLLKAVADKLVSLTRKADLSASIVTQAQSLISKSSPDVSIKVGMLEANSAIRLTPISANAASQLASASAQILNTQLSSIQGELTQGLLTSNIGQPILSFNGQTQAGAPLSFSSLALVQSTFGFQTPQNAPVSFGAYSGGQAGSSLPPHAFSFQGNGGAGGGSSLHAGQSYTFPSANNGQMTLLDAKVLNGLSSQLLSQPVAPQFVSSQSMGLSNAQFVLNGQAGALTLQVTGMTAQQQPVLTPLFATAGGHVNSSPPSFVMQFPAQNVSVGSLIHFQPLGWGQGGGASIVPIDPFSSLMLSIKELQVAQPQLAHTLSMVAPSASVAPSQPGAAMLFLFSALQGGKLDGWLGQGADTIASKHKILQTLEQTLKDGLSPKLMQNTPSGDWRMYSLPMQTQDSVVPIALYIQDHYQQPSEQESEEDEIKVTRFVFEFDLTRMGEVQVDGLMREKNVDIFIRTRKDLSSDMKKMVRNVYLNALERSDLTGDVAFQHDSTKRVDVTPRA